MLGRLTRYVIFPTLRVMPHLGGTDKRVPQERETPTLKISGGEIIKYNTR